MKRTHRQDNIPKHFNATYYHAQNCEKID